MRKVFLLADDDADDRWLFTEALEQIDPLILCYSVSDGRKALDVLKNNDVNVPQIIFLDVNMPGMDGWECLTELKKIEAYEKIPVLIYSTSGNYREATIALDLGALCFFTKPSDFIELRDMLKVIVANLDGNLLEAIKHFNSVKSRQIFSCSESKKNFKN